MKTIKKLVSLFLLLCLCLPTMALGEGEPWRADAANMPITAEKSELTVWTVITGDVEDMNTNEQTLYYEELTNVHVNWIPVGNTDAAQMKNLSLVSGEYPDIYMTTFSPSEVLTYGVEEGVLIPLDDLIEKYAPNVRKAMEIAPYLREMVTAPDGHIYTLWRAGTPNYTEGFSQKLWVFQPWLQKYMEATGKGEPTTLDEYRAMLEYFRDNDMNGNGDATDEIPLMGTYAFDNQGSDPMYHIMNAFTYFPDNLVYARDGAVHFAATGDGFREGLKYVRGLVTDGLLDPLTYTQDLNQYRAVVNVSRPEDMVVGSAAAPYYMRFVTESIYSRAAQDFFVVQPLAGANGMAQTPKYEQALMLNWAITSACEDPVAAIKWLDYLVSREMTIYTAYGDEGTDWYASGAYDDVNGPTIHVVNKSLMAAGASTQNRRWTAWIARFFLPGVYNAFTLDLEENTIVFNQKRAHELYEKFAVADNVPAIIWCNDTDLALEVQELSSQVNDYAANMWTQFILGTLDINDDAQWAAYEQGLIDAGVERYTEILKEYWGI